MKPLSKLAKRIVVDARPSEFDVSQKPPHPFDHTNDVMLLSEEEDVDDEEDFPGLARSDATKKSTTKRPRNAMAQVLVWGDGSKKAEADGNFELERVSQGPLASYVVEEIALGEKGSFKGFVYLLEAKALERHSTDPHLLFCNVCAGKATMGTRANVWKKHVSRQE